MLQLEKVNLVNLSISNYLKEVKNGNIPKLDVTLVKPFAPALGFCMMHKQVSLMVRSVRSICHTSLFLAMLLHIVEYITGRVENHYGLLEEYLICRSNRGIDPRFVDMNGSMVFGEVVTRYIPKQHLLPLNCTEHVYAPITLYPKYRIFTMLAMLLSGVIMASTSALIYLTEKLSSWCTETRKIYRTNSQTKQQMLFVLMLKRLQQRNFTQDTLTYYELVTDEKNPLEAFHVIIKSSNKYLEVLRKKENEPIFLKRELILIEKAIDKAKEINSKLTSGARVESIIVGLVLCKFIFALYAVYIRAVNRLNICPIYNYAETARTITQNITITALLLIIHQYEKRYIDTLLCNREEWLMMDIQQVLKFARAPSELSPIDKLTIIGRLTVEGIYDSDLSESEHLLPLIKKLTQHME